MKNINDNELYVKFHGGEPLIEYNKILYTVKKIKDSFNGKINYSIITNAILINEQIVEFLFENRFDVSISIDGKKESNDKNRIYPNGKGTYNDTYKGFLIMKKKFHNLRGRMTVCKNNLEDFYENILFFINLEINPISPAINIFEDWTDNELRFYENQIKKLAEHLKDKSEYDYFFKQAERKSKNSICDGGTSTIHILPNGDLYPCTFAVENNKYKAGNIYNGINNNLVNKIFDMANITNKICVGCQRYDYCMATRCKIINDIMTGDPHMPSPVLCELENISVSINKFYNKIILK